MIMDGETKIEQEAVSGKGQPSADGGSSPSIEPVKTYTEAEVAARHSKLDKMIAQLTRERDVLKQDSEATKQQFADIQRRIDEQEEEQARGDPDSLKLYQRQKKLRDLESQLKTQQRQIELERQQFTDKIRRADELEAENLVISAAMEHHVDIGELKVKVQKFNLTTEEQIAEMAAILASSGRKLPPKGDSGRSVGGTDFDSMSPREKIEAGLKASK